MRSSLCLLLLVSGALPAFAEEAAMDRTVNDGNVVLESVPEVPADLRARLARFQNTRSASFQDWAPGGEGLYVTTRFGETTQIHHVESPGGARHQLTFFDEPARSVERRPGGSDFTFQMDEGGSEFNQIFLLDPASGVHRRLTDGTSRNGAVEWSRDGSHLAYQSTRRNGRSNDLWVMDPADPETARLALEAPGGAFWAPTDWSLDGGQLLVIQYVSVNISRIHLVDLESGERRLLVGGDDAPGNYVGISPSFDTSGDGIDL